MDLANLYVPIIPETSKIAPGVRRAAQFAARDIQRHLTDTLNEGFSRLDKRATSSLSHFAEYSASAGRAVEQNFARSMETARQLEQATERVIALESTKKTKADEYNQALQDQQHWYRQNERALEDLSIANAQYNRKQQTYEDNAAAARKRAAQEIAQQRQLDATADERAHTERYNNTLKWLRAEQTYKRFNKAQDEKDLASGVVSAEAAHTKRYNDTIKWLRAERVYRSFNKSQAEKDQKDEVLSAEAAHTKKYNDTLKWLRAERTFKSFNKAQDAKDLNSSVETAEAAHARRYNNTLKWLRAERTYHGEMQRSQANAEAAFNQQRIAGMSGWRRALYAAQVDQTRVANQFHNSMRGAIDSVVEHGNRSMTGMTRGMMTAMGAPLGIRASAAGVGILGAYGVTRGASSMIQGGFERLTTIQNAQVAMNAILRDNKTATKLIQDTYDLAQGTPFGTDVFMAAARNMVAMGVKAEQVVPAIKSMADAVATMGQGNDELMEVSEIFGKIQAEGHIMGRDVYQLQRHGINARTILGNATGMTASEVTKQMSQKGGLDVPSDQIIDILTKGIEQGSSGTAGSTPAYGGGMQALRKTVTGSISVLKSQMARVGAALLGGADIQKPTGLFARMPNLINGISDKFRAMANPGGPLDQFSKRLESSGALDGLVSLLTKLPGLVTGTFDGINRLWDLIKSPGVQTFVDGISNGFGKVWKVVKDIWPDLVKIGGAIAKGFGGAALIALQATATTLQAISPLIRALASTLSAMSPVLTAVTATWALFALRAKAAAFATGGIASAMGRFSKQTYDYNTNSLKTVSIFSQMRDKYRSHITDINAVAGARRTLTDARSFGMLQNEAGVWGTMASSYQRASTALGGLTRTQAAARTAMSGLKAVGSGLMGAMGGPWGLAITSLGVGLGYLASKHAEAKAAAEEQKQAEQELRDTLQSTLQPDTGAITAKTREEITGKLTDSGQLRAAEQAGIDPKLVVDAVVNQNEDAYLELKKQLAAKNTTGGGPLASLAEDVAHYFNAMSDAAEKQRLFNRALSGSWVATDKAKEKFSALGATINEIPNDKTISLTVPDDKVKGFKDEMALMGADVQQIEGTHTFIVKAGVDDADFQSLVAQVKVGDKMMIDIDGDTGPGRAEEYQWRLDAQGNPILVPITLDEDSALTQAGALAKSISQLLNQNITNFDLHPNQNPTGTYTDLFNVPGQLPPMLTPPGGTPPPSGPPTGGLNLPGITPPKRPPGRRKGGLVGFLSGGRLDKNKIYGPGTGTSDSILGLVDGQSPIAVSNGESVVTKSGTEANWEYINGFNNGLVLPPMKHLKGGGEVGPGHPFWNVNNVVTLDRWLEENYGHDYFSMQNRKGAIPHFDDGGLLGKYDPSLIDILLGRGGQRNNWSDYNTYDPMQHKLMHRNMVGVDTSGLRTPGGGIFNQGMAIDTSTTTSSPPPKYGYDEWRMTYDDVADAATYQEGERDNPKFYERQAILNNDPLMSWIKEKGGGYAPGGLIGGGAAGPRRPLPPGGGLFGPAWTPPTVDPLAALSRLQNAAPMRGPDVLDPNNPATPGFNYDNPLAAIDRGITTFGTGASQAAGNIISGTAQSIAHPIQAVQALGPLFGTQGLSAAGSAWKGMGQSLTHWNEWKDNPLGALGGATVDIGSLFIGGGLGGAGRVGAAGSRVRNLIPNIPKPFVPAVRAPVDLGMPGVRPYGVSQFVPPADVGRIIAENMSPERIAGVNTAARGVAQQRLNAQGPLSMSQAMGMLSAQAVSPRAWKVLAGSVRDASDSLNWSLPGRTNPNRGNILQKNIPYSTGNIPFSDSRYYRSVLAPNFQSLFGPDGMMRGFGRGGHGDRLSFNRGFALDKYTSGPDSVSNMIIEGLADHLPIDNSYVNVTTEARQAMGAYGYVNPFSLQDVLSGKVPLRVWQRKELPGLNLADNDLWELIHDSFPSVITRRHGLGEQPPGTLDLESKYPESFTSAEIDPNEFRYTAHHPDTDDIMGSLTLSPDSYNGSNFLDVAGIETFPQFRGQGVAKSLLERAMADHPGWSINPGETTALGQGLLDHLVATNPVARKLILGEGLPGPRQFLGTPTFPPRFNIQRYNGTRAPGSHHTPDPDEILYAALHPRTGQGMGQLSVSPRTTSEGLNSLYVNMIKTRPEFRGKGIAKALLERMTQEHPGVMIDPGELTRMGEGMTNHLLATNPEYQSRVLPGRPFASGQIPSLEAVHALRDAAARGETVSTADLVKRLHNLGMPEMRVRPLPTHPNGMRAIGFKKNGDPIWPIAGGASDDVEKLYTSLMRTAGQRSTVSTSDLAGRIAKPYSASSRPRIAGSDAARFNTWATTYWEATKAYGAASKFIREGMLDGLHGYEGMSPGTLTAISEDLAEFWHSTQQEAALSSGMFGLDQIESLQAIGREWSARAVHSDPTHNTLHRGVKMDPAHLASLARGQVHSMSPQSFVDRTDLDFDQFASKPLGWQPGTPRNHVPVHYELQPGAHATALYDRTMAGQPLGELIAGGDMRIADIIWGNKDKNRITRVLLEQLGIVPSALMRPQMVRPDWAGRTGRVGIQGPGTGTSDSILGMLNGIEPINVSNGESIVTAAGTSANKEWIDGFNNGLVLPKMRKFAGGATDLQSGQSGGGYRMNRNEVADIASQFQLPMTSGDRNEPGSYHSTGMAGDFSNGVQTDQELAFANYMAQNYGRYISELIYDDPRFTSCIKDGRNVGPFGQFYTMSQAGNHTNHVHVAVGPEAFNPVGGGYQGTSSALGANKFLAGAAGLGPTPNPSSVDIAGAIAGEAQARGYSPSVAIGALAASKLESGWNPNITNASGHHGLFQQSADKPSQANAMEQIKWFFDEMDAQGGPGAANADPLNFIADRIEKGGYPGSNYQQFVGDATGLYTQAVQAGAGQGGNANGPLSYNEYGEAGYYYPDPAGVAKAEEAKRKADADLAIKQQKQAELKADASESQQMKAEEDVRAAEEKADQATADLEDAKKGKFKKATQAQLNGTDGGADGQGQDNSKFQSVGQAIFGGILQSIGLDGSVFSNPFEWPNVKSLMAGLNFGGALLKGLGAKNNPNGGGGQTAYGLDGNPVPALGGGGGGGGGLSGILGGLTSSLGIQLPGADTNNPTTYQPGATGLPQLPGDANMYQAAGSPGLSFAMPNVQSATPPVDANGNPIHGTQAGFNPGPGPGPGVQISIDNSVGQVGESYDAIQSRQATSTNLAVNKFQNSSLVRG